ncbi:MAG: chemotaxis protein CheC, partial [Syntrophaceticus sp.]
MAVDEYLKLNNIQLDALREVGNIGAGNAATALSKLISSRVEMSVPDIKILSFPEIVSTIGGAETSVAGICLQIQGEAPGTILFLIPDTDAVQIVCTLLKKRNVQFFNDELACSALVELGNILAGSFLNALGEFTSICFIPTVPALCIDMVGAILGSILYKLGMASDYVLFIKTDFRYQGKNGIGYLYYLPESEALQKILSAL